MKSPANLLGLTFLAGIMGYAVYLSNPDGVVAFPKNLTNSIVSTVTPRLYTSGPGKLDDIATSLTDFVRSIVKPQPYTSEPRKPNSVGHPGYDVIISCGIRDVHYNVLSCFTKTDLIVTRNNFGKVYKIYEIQSLGQERRDGLHFHVPEHFEIEAQNSSEMMLLGVTIRDSEGNIVFSREAGWYGIVLVRN